MVTPDDHSAFGSYSFPSSSKGFEILKIANLFTIIRKRDIWAKCAPGQALRPKPNTNLEGSTCGVSPKNRCGGAEGGPATLMWVGKVCLRIVETGKEQKGA